VPAGLDAETLARLIARHGSPEAAAEKARQDPRFDAVFREATGLQWMTMARADEPGNRAATAEYWQAVAAWDRLIDEPVDGSGAFLPLKLIERALRMHVRDKCGRRTLAKNIPGLTEWTAGQLLSWYRVGEPNGLWLDGEQRVQVGAKLAPTRGGVRLPRI
jgi:hypothetical protein